MGMALYLYDELGESMEEAYGNDELYEGYEEHLDLVHILTAGKTYYLRVSGWSDEANFDYTITYAKTDNKFFAQVDGPTSFKLRVREQVSLHINAIGNDNISYSWKNRQRCC